MHINKIFIILFFSVIFSQLSFAQNLNWNDLGEVNKDIRTERGWPDSERPHPFFAANLKANLDLMGEKINHFITTIDSIRISKESLTLVHEAQFLMDSFIARANAEKEHNLVSHVFYNSMIIKLADIINELSGALSEGEKTYWKQVAPAAFLNFAATASVNGIVKIRDELSSIAFSANAEHRISKIIEYGKSSRDNEKPEWFYYYCFRLIDSNYLMIHCIKDLTIHDLNFALSRQIALIGMTPHSVKYDGRSSGPWEFADHDIDCHARSMHDFKRKIDEVLEENFTPEQLAPLEEEHTSIRFSLSNLIRTKGLLTGPTTWMADFRDAIYAIEDENLKFDLRLGYFMACHERYGPFDNLLYFQRGGDKFEKWKDINDIGALLPAHILESVSDEIIGDYVRKMTENYCTFRDEWFSTLSGLGEQEMKDLEIIKFLSQKN